MKRFLLPMVLAFVGTSALSSAQVIDVDQPSVNAVMAGFSQGDLAQSFQPTTSNCAGGGVSMTPGWGVGGTLTVQLWDALPNVGGALMLASGSAPTTPGTWTDVLWPSVPVTPGTTYYMVYFCTDGGMAIDGDTANPYAGGQVYANPGYGSFPTFDYTFRTWTDGGGLALSITGTCPGPMTASISGATANGSVALAYGPAGSFTLSGGSCAGTVIGISAPTLAGFFNADASGNLTLSPNVPAGLCGLTLQAADMSTCSVSNTVVL